jgi:hypothetical protein
MTEVSVSRTAEAEMRYIHADEVPPDIDKAEG